MTLQNKVVIDVNGGGQRGIAVAIDFIDLPDPPSGKSYHLTTICDGLAALNKVGIEKEYIRSSGKYVYLIPITSSLWTSSSFKFNNEHIYAHQDDNDMGPLSMKANLNCKMNTIAKDIVLIQISYRINI